jgi:hypothetical protein
MGGVSQLGLTADISAIGRGEVMLQSAAPVRLATVPYASTVPKLVTGAALPFSILPLVRNRIWLPPVQISARLACSRTFLRRALSCRLQSIDRSDREQLQSAHLQAESA